MFCQICGIDVPLTTTKCPKCGGSIFVDDTVKDEKTKQKDSEILTPLVSQTTGRWGLLCFLFSLFVVAFEGGFTWSCFSLFIGAFLVDRQRRVNKENNIKIRRVKYMIVCYAMFALIVVRNNVLAYHRLNDDQESTGEHLQYDNLADLHESLMEKVNSTSGGSAPILNPEITDWESYVKNLQRRATNGTTLQRTELLKKEIGRIAEVEIRVRDVSESIGQLDYDEAIVINAEYQVGGHGHRWGAICILVPDAKDSRQAYKQALQLKKGAHVRVLGRVYYDSFELKVMLQLSSQVPGLSGEFDAPKIVAIKLEVMEDEDVEDGL